MKNGAFVKYDGKLVHFMRDGQEFLMYPGDRLTQVPVTKSDKFQWLRQLWYMVAPEFYCAYKRRRSHLHYLDKWAFIDPKYKDTKYRNYFGSQSHIADETVRALHMPPQELLPFDGKKKNTVRQMILDAIKVHKDSTKSEG